MRKLPPATLRVLSTLVLQGLPSRDVARRLGLAKSTVNNFAARIQSGTQRQRQELANMSDVLLQEFFYPPALLYLGFLID